MKIIMSEYLNDLVDKAIELKDKGKYQESINILKDISDKFPDYEKLNGVYVIIAGNYFELELYNECIQYSKKIIEIKSEIEIASLLLYLSYFNINEHEKAYMTLFNYLEKHRANLFKDTLEELLEDLSEGYGVKYKEKILFFAKKNNVSIAEN